MLFSLVPKFHQKSHQLKVGLKIEFESGIEVKLKLKSLAAVAFVPSNEVRAVFGILGYLQILFQMKTSSKNFDLLLLHKH